MKGKAEGLAEGIEKGKAEGFEQGKKKVVFDIAKQMLEQGMDMETVGKITNLSQHKIQAIQSIIITLKINS